MSSRKIFESHQPRVIRIFVSSTFRDMHQEREELVKFIFPKLRKLCEERGVTWGEVDLRWGITDEQKAEGKVLPICLAEIHRCRPYFVGLLGERYGWVPREIPREIIEQEPWLAEHLDHSVTELEILHGVLRNREMADHAYFYFRDPTYISTLPVDQQTDFQERPTEEEIKQFGEEEAERRARGRRQKLDALKEKIKKSGLPVRENYHNPKELGELVLQDLTEVINQLFPEEVVLDPLDREAAEHDAFAGSRRGVYIGRNDYFDRLDEHAQADGPPLVVLGESGSGKSALMANWAFQYKEKHPSETLIMHFIGSSPQSADWMAMLRRIMGEFKRIFNIKSDIPDQPETLREAFANWLHMAAARGRAVVILDGLNQLEDRDQAPDLIWLPPEIPSNIRLILSTLPGRSLNDLKKRKWPTMHVEELDYKERKILIAAYLAQYSKALNPNHVEQITAIDQTSNPLYLRALLEELRIFGKYEQLEARIGYYLGAKTIPELFEKILERYEQDYERDCPDLVKSSMRLLWAARRGLSETELLEMLGSNGGPLPGAYWSPLYLAAERALVKRSGLIGFSHDYFRQAVQNRYLSTERIQKESHLNVAEYFETRVLGPRKVDELPWQLARAKSWQRLVDLLADLPFFKTAWKANEFEVKSYWAQVEANSEIKIEEAYAGVLSNPGKSFRSSWCLAILLNDMGHLDEAFKLLQILATHYRQTNDRERLAGALNFLGGILQARDDNDGAMALYKEEESICRELGNKDGLWASLSGQGVILHYQGVIDGALMKHKEAEKICRESGNKHGLSRTLGNQAVILKSCGDLDGAMTLHKKAEMICRELGNKDVLAVTLANQANILDAQGDFEGAMKLHKEAEKICRELGHRDMLEATLANQALILQTQGDLDGAMALLEERVRICREMGRKSMLSDSLDSLALILYARGDLKRAMDLHKEAEKICRERGDKDGLSRTLGNQANILAAQGNSKGAMALYKEVERISREQGKKDARKKGVLAAALGNQALILKRWGDLHGAMALHKEEERICREMGNKYGLQRSLGNQASILYARRDLEGAIAMYRENERICRELGNKDALAAALGNQALILESWGNLDGAIALLKEVERISRELGKKEALVISLINQALILGSKLGQSERALPLAEEAYKLATRHGFMALAQQIEPILVRIRSEVSY